MSETMPKISNESPSLWTMALFLPTQQQWMFYNI